MGLVALAACTARFFDPVSIGGGGNGGGTTGGTGGSGGAAIPSALVGTWEATFIIQTIGDIQTTTTTWRFGGDGSCRRTVRTLSAVEGIPRTDDRTCRFRVGNFQLTVTFTDGGAATFSFEFAGGSRDRLLLGGIEYQRTG